MDPFEEKRSMLYFRADQVEWTKEKYSLTSLKEKGCSILPTLIHITSGYFGKDYSDTFSSEDILVLYEWKLQERVLAKKDKVCISIPLDFEYKLEVMEAGMPGRLMYMSQIIQKYEPPVKVRFGPNTKVSFTLGTKEVQAKAFGAFTLVSSHFLEYATASATFKGKISTEELVCLPIHRRIRFEVATQLHGIPMDQQRHHFHSILDHMETTLTLGILEYTELLDTMEDYDYIRIIPSGAWGKPRNDLSHTNNGQNNVQKKGEPDLDYELIEINPRPAVHKRPIFGETDPRPNSPMGAIHGKQKQVTPISPLPLMHSSSKPAKRDLTPLVVPQAPSLIPSSSTTSKLPPPLFPRPLRPIFNIPATPSSADALAANITANLSHPNQSPPLSVFPMTMIEEMKCTILAKKKTALFPGAKTSQTKGSVNVPHPLVFHTLGDVPTDLTDLSVDEICQCLELLHLGEFGPRFKYALIDGRLLSGCSAEDLKREFSMGHVSARKLVMFANDGWRPKE